jgi:MFS family permease
MLLLTRRVEGARLRPEPTVIAPRCPGVPWCVRARAYFPEGPFANPRFLFFVFMLLPVRTLFAHQWLTVPEYILRAYSKEVADRMEWLVNWTNPLVIFLGVPVLTALTRRVDVYTMMIVGTLVSAAPTYLLAFGPSLGLLIAYLVVFSVGEALWFPRFLEYAAELAPPGRVAQYMGLAQVPWLLAKGTTGFYSGYMLATFCPANTPPDQLHTGIMWLVYATIGMTSPLGLWLARRWVRSAPLSFAR